MTSIYIHQPHFIPWIPYLSRMWRADAFVVLDNVQYRSRYYQNRTVVVDEHGNYTWITIPVVRHHLPIRNTFVQSGHIRRVSKTLQNYYPKKRDYFNVLPGFSLQFENAGDNLLDINLSTLQWGCSILDMPSKPTYLASDLSLSEDPTRRVLEICEALSAKVIVCGWGGTLKVHRIDEFMRAGIEIWMQEASSTYAGLPDAKNGLSFVHSIFNLGPQQCRGVVQELASTTFRMVG